MSEPTLGDVMKLLDTVASTVGGLENSALETQADLRRLDGSSWPCAPTFKP